MKLDLETRRSIAMDLATLSRYESLEVIEGRLREQTIHLFGSAKAVAESYREMAKQRLATLTQWGIGATGLVSIQECIHQLDAFITAEQEVNQ